MRRQLAPRSSPSSRSPCSPASLYPLVVTGVAQLAFPSRADGSLVERDGTVVGSRLIGQAFAGAALLPAAPVGGRRRIRRDVELGVEPRADERGVPRGGREARGGVPARERSRAGADVPADAVTASGSGLDPHISPANARIQAARVARRAGSALGAVLELVERHTDGRSLGFLGEPGVNVLELNLALDRQA